MHAQESGVLHTSDGGCLDAAGNELFHDFVASAVDALHAGVRERAADGVLPPSFRSYKNMRSIHSVRLCCMGKYIDRLHAWHRHWKRNVHVTPSAVHLHSVVRDLHLQVTAPVLGLEDMVA